MKSNLFVHETHSSKDAFKNRAAKIILTEIAATLEKKQANRDI